MQFSTIAAVALSVISVSACAPGEGGATCLTSGGSWLYTISPFSGAVLVPDQPFDITWDACGNDFAFLNANITFEIADATNPNNVQSISAGQLTFKTQPNVTNLKATATVPTGLLPGKNYTIKSSYHDIAANKWTNCFGNTFFVGSKTAATVSNATVTPTGSKSGGFETSFVASAAAILGALVLPQEGVQDFLQKKGGQDCAMYFLIFVFLDLIFIGASLVLGQSGCTTTAAASIDIVNPHAGAIVTVGQPLEIKWQIIRGELDPSFASALIEFEIAPTNQTIGTNLSFSQPLHVNQLNALTVVPNITNGNAYVVKSTFVDGNVTRTCQSLVFQVIGGVNESATLASTTQSTVTLLPGLTQSNNSGEAVLDNNDVTPMGTIMGAWVAALAATGVAVAIWVMRKRRLKLSTTPQDMEALEINDSEKKEDGFVVAVSSPVQIITDSLNERVTSLDPAPSSPEFDPLSLEGSVNAHYLDVNGFVVVPRSPRSSIYFQKALENVRENATRMAIDEVAEQPGQDRVSIDAK
ncbi:UNVERIFIED_CONTAM: hypothetical protein HDU68_006369 [Siphonaria sp. JEL0065]|nr:hypothetical protein HDU68_006369 [Siphonaria sp. JEL0065]